MKIFYITTSIRGKTGLAKMIAYKANYFAKNYKYDVNIITWQDYFENSFYPLHESISHFDLKLRDKGLFAKMNKINAILKKENPDVVLVADDYFTAAFYPLLLKRTYPIILERHSIIVYGYGFERSIKLKIVNKVKAFFTKLGARSYDKVVLLSNEALKEWGNLKHMIAINNPLMFFPNETAIVENKKVLAVGRYDYVKGFDILLHVWKKVSPLFPDWELNLYGDNIQKRLNSLVEELDLTNTVNLNPATKEINKVYLDSSIYTMTSRSEGFGLVLVEAMSFGLPVMSFDCPTGPKDIIKDNEDGFLIPVGDIDSYAKKLGLLIQDKTLRKQMGQNGKQNIKRLNPEIIMSKWDKVIKELSL